MTNSDFWNINCIGCGLCKGMDSQLQFDLNKDGYYRPNFSLNYDFNKLRKICPIFYDKTDDISDVWGKYISVKKAYANDTVINEKASSGGVVSTMLIWMLENSIIDAVIQVGKSKENPLENQVYISTSQEDVMWCCGSRYAPASPLVSLESCLDKNMKYAFVGKPCDCRALRKFLNNEPQYMEKIVLIFSFFCAGTPSRNATLELIKAVDSDYESVSSISYRGNGWPGYATVIDKTGEHRMEYEKSWGGILGRRKQQFCRICAEGTGDAGDISCGDAWNMTEDLKPDFKDAAGRNIVFLRSSRGMEMFQRCVDEQVLSSEDYNIEYLKYIQPYQYERKTTLLSQVLALKLSGKYVPSYSWKALFRLSKKNSVKSNIRIFIGTIKRVMRKQIR